MLTVAGYYVLTATLTLLLYTRFNPIPYYCFLYTGCNLDIGGQIHIVFTLYPNLFATSESLLFCTEFLRVGSCCLLLVLLLTCPWNCCCRQPPIPMPACLVLPMLLFRPLFENSLWLKLGPAERLWYDFSSHHRLYCTFFTCTLISIIDAYSVFTVNLC